MLASRNPHKLKEISALLAGFQLTVIAPGLFRQTGAGPDENGGTFIANARIKALHFSRHSDQLTLGEDSGLEVRALNGRPGIHSSRYAGNGASDSQRIVKLLGELSGITERRARFVCALVLALKGTELFSCSGSAAGLILTEPRGRNGFGYDPVFFYPPLGKTFAELSAAEKNRVSHRHQAILRLVAYLKSL